MPHDHDHHHAHEHHHDEQHSTVSVIDASSWQSFQQYFELLEKSMKQEEENTKGTKNTFLFVTAIIFSYGYWTEALAIRIHSIANQFAKNITEDNLFGKLCKCFSNLGQDPVKLSESLDFFLEDDQVQSLSQSVASFLTKTPQYHLEQVLISHPLFELNHWYHIFNNPKLKKKKKRQHSAALSRLIEARLWGIYAFELEDDDLYEHTLSIDPHHVESLEVRALLKFKEKDATSYKFWKSLYNKTHFGDGRLFSWAIYGLTSLIELYEPVLEGECSKEEFQVKLKQLDLTEDNFLSEMLMSYGLATLSVHRYIQFFKDYQQLPPPLKPCQKHIYDYAVSFMKYLSNEKKLNLGTPIPENTRFSFLST